MWLLVALLQGGGSINLHCPLRGWGEVSPPVLWPYLSAVNSSCGSVPPSPRLRNHGGLWRLSAHKPRLDPCAGFFLMRRNRRSQGKIQLGKQKSYLMGALLGVSLASKHENVLLTPNGAVCMYTYTYTRGVWQKWGGRICPWWKHPLFTPCPPPAAPIISEYPQKATVLVSLVDGSRKEADWNQMRDFTQSRWIRCFANERAGGQNVASRFFRDKNLTFICFLLLRN